MIGIVTKSHGNWYSVFVHGEAIACRLLGKWRLNTDKFTNPIAVGDRVKIQLEPDKITATIIELLPRANYIIRQSPHKKMHKQIIASNIDLVCIVATIVNPTLKRGFIDRVLLNTEIFGIETCIIFNKIDIYAQHELEELEYVQQVYNAIGYQTFCSSTVTGEGIDFLKSKIKDKKTLICGHSGVGKSSLLNEISTDIQQKTNLLSNYSGKGMHTTTYVQMFSVDETTFIIDSPGIKEFDVLHLQPNEVAKYMREFVPYFNQCNFDDCKHINEPKCAVLHALELGEIDEIRYQNYEHILENIQDKNYWERE